MKKSFLIIIMLSASLLVNAQTNSRWTPLVVGADDLWDSQSARKLDTDTVRFWYQSPFMEEQRDYLVKSGTYTRAEVNLITHGRIGVVAKCKAKQYGFFSVTEIKENGAPISPGVNILMEDVKMRFIGPDTNIEAFVNAVCKHFGIRQ